MNECPECSLRFYGNKCKCGFVINRNSKSSAPEQPKVPAYFIETFSVDKVTKPVFGSVSLQKCAVNACQNAGTMTNSTSHQSSENARWVCQHHFR